MKTKRRTVNVDVNLCNKKIITRNMKNKIVEDKTQSITMCCDNVSANKTSPNTRAKSSSTGKLDSDPYSFSKMDEEYKIPMKKMKMTEKNEKDISVKTCHIATMTDPELLGPCEPGTSIALQGIVWLETETGLLVINVTWKGRTYVGTLLDSSKYPFSTQFNSADCSLKSENRQTNVTNRGRKRYLSPRINYHSGLRSTTIHHSRRFSDSFSHANNLKKSTTRPAQNLNSCYVDSLSLSADGSCSGESDLELNNLKKYPLTNKTRSVTRSLARQNKVVIRENDNNSNELDPLKNLKHCTQFNCFKKFSNSTALRYHLHRSHGVLEEIQIDSEINDDNNVQNSTVKNSVMVLELDNNTVINDNAPMCTRLNGKIKMENELFEFTSDSEIDKYENNVNNLIKNNLKAEKLNRSAVSDNPSDKSNKCQSPFTELFIKLPQLSELISDSCDVPNSPKESIRDEKPIYDEILLPENVDLSETPRVLFNETIVTDSIVSPESIIHQHNHIIRTVSAPTVTIPHELNTMVTSNIVNTMNALIRPKPSSIPLNVSQNPYSIKQRLSKCNGGPNFQIPSSTVPSKKRPLIPLKVTVTQSLNSTQNMILSNTTSVNAISQNQSSRHIRTSTFSTVTPILPATSSLNCMIPILSNSNTSISSNSSNVSTSCITNTKRILPTSNSSSPTGVNSMLNLKPIQPKPKVPSSISTYSNPTSSAISTPISTAILPGMLTSQTSYQRQILPSPVSKTENVPYSEERSIHRNDTLKSMPIKKKRKKSDKKLRSNFPESNKISKFPLNAIQPKKSKDHQGFISNSSYFPKSLDNYKIDEENSHSPGYSDFSETNDTPAPILEKEIELKSGDCDKLIICTDVDSTESANRISSSCLDSYDDNKDSTVYNKPPALMPAVLSADILNGPTNEIDISDSLAKTGRRKLQTNQKSSICNGANTDPSKGSGNTKNLPSSLRHNNAYTSSRRSFQPSSLEEPVSSSLFSSSPSSSSPSKVSLYNLSHNHLNKCDQNLKSKLPIKCSNLSAINDYVWLTKNNHDSKSKDLDRLDYSLDGECSKKKVIQAQTLDSKEKFSVQALTSQQEIVSRSITSSSTVLSANPNTKLPDLLFKN